MTPRELDARLAALQETPMLAYITAGLFVLTVCALTTWTIIGGWLALAWPKPLGLVVLVFHWAAYALAFVRIVELKVED